MKELEPLLVIDSVITLLFLIFSLAVFASIGFVIYKFYQKYLKEK